MLTLEPPFYEIDGVIVYRDHAVPTQFYYAAPEPRIARTGGRLMFDLMSYSVDLRHSPLTGTSIPDELGAGFLTMGVECPLSDSQRANLVRELADLSALPEERIALYPIPYSKGTVSVLALDKFTAPAGAPADPGSPTPLTGRPTFVEQILGSGTPSLLGDLRSIFSLSLSQQGVAFLSGLFADRAAPVGVVYDLRFYGLRPAVDAVVSANLGRIYQHFGGGLSGQYQWVKAEIKAGIDYLEEHGDIRVRLTSQAVGEEAQKSKELALALFRDQIVQALFRPTAPNPAMTAASLGSSLLGAGTTRTPGAGVVLTLEHKRSEELKDVEYHFHERAPEERSHAPQGFLPVLLSPQDLQQRIHHINLGSSFFDLLEVLVTGPSTEVFEQLNIRQIEATLTYGTPGDAVPPKRETLLFRPDSTGDKVFAARRDGRKSLAYTAALTYEFDRAAGSDTDGFRYEIPPRTVTGRSLLINPYADFGVLDVEIEWGRIHPDVREVDLHLVYPVPDARFQASEQIRLRATDGQPAARRQRWQVRTRETEIIPYTVTATFVFQDGSSYQSPPQTFSDPLLRVDAPFQYERELLIRPNPISQEITEITVELEYEDAAHRYRRRRLVNLQAPFHSVQESWPILDPNQRRVRYRVTVHEPGLLSEGEWEETTDPSIIVGSEAHRVAKVLVQLIGPPLDAVGLDAVHVRIALALPGATGEEPRSVLLQPGETSATVELTLPPGSTLRYRYQTLAFRSDGQVTESAWKEMTSSPLILSTRTL